MRIVLAALVLALAAPAHAFCGFFVAGSDAKLYNNASQVVLLRKGSHTTMTLSNHYQGPLEDFAMVVPVPVVLHKEDVKTLAPDVFDHVDALSAPRLVEYWERDPCRPLRVYHGMPKGAAAKDELDGALGGGGKLGVRVEAQFAVGEYEIVILSAEESTGLETWLRLNHYRIPDGAADALAPYVRQQSKFFVAKVDIHKVHKDEHGKVVLSPLRFGFEANELRLPVRLGLLNAGPKQDLIVYVLSPKSRFEVANYPNVFAPTNLDVADSVRRSFPSFYAQLFDATLAAQGGRAVVTEYAWDSDSCDPCPTPPLEPGDLQTLGDDGDSPGGGWVVTRLHARYDKQSLSEDLVFREAPPAEGGRSDFSGGAGENDAHVVEGGSNNYQARYIIRHYWKGPVACASPRWGTWGGPPSGDEPPPPSAAKGLAEAPRGKVSLKQVVNTAVPRLKLPGHAAPQHKSAP
jgi:hypothetical protein